VQPRLEVRVSPNGGWLVSGADIAGSVPFGTQREAVAHATATLSALGGEVIVFTSADVEKQRLQVQPNPGVPGAAILGPVGDLQRRLTEANTSLKTELNSRLKFFGAVLALLPASVNGLIREDIRKSLSGGYIKVFIATLSLSLAAAIVGFVHTKNLVDSAPLLFWIAGALATSVVVSELVGIGQISNLDTSTIKGSVPVVAAQFIFRVVKAGILSFGPFGFSSAVVVGGFVGVKAAALTE
jgi:uncharacterized membrane protein YdcZ (DUF606 family)